MFYSQSGGNPIIRHPTYYFEDGNLYIMAENVLFNVHRSVLSANATLLDNHIPQWTGRSENEPYHLKGVKAQDFSKLLTLIYPSSVTDFSVDDWISILEQSEAWGCTRIRAAAVDTLRGLPMDAALKIATWKKYGLDEEQIARCYHELGTRPQPLSIGEAQLLGMELMVKLAGLRDSVHEGVLTYFRDCVGENANGVIPADHVRDLVCRVLVTDFIKETPINDAYATSS